MGTRLAHAIRTCGTARLALQPSANEIFAILPKALEARLKAAGAMFHPWSVETLRAEERPGPDEVLVRLITSFQTRPEDVDRFGALLAAG
jgi:threonine aldolase